MIFHATPLPGAFVIEVKRITDDRGFFGRAWCEKELQDHGLVGKVVQANVGFSHRAGTLRGLHFQNAPHAEVKIVRCTRGAVFDVVVDLRRESSTYLKWFGTELTQDNHKMMYVPVGFATGYITLTDNAEICYNTSAAYQPDCASGVRYNDPAFGIQWPMTPAVISRQDQEWPDYSGRVTSIRFN